MVSQANGSPVLHIRYEGRSFDVPLSDLDVGTLSSDEAIKCALAAYLNIEVAKLQYYVIDRHETGNLTVRPQAVFG
jgi:hypothetical protein